MKKLLCVILSVLLALTVPVIGAGCSDKDRESKLKLYLPGEYIDEDIFEEFEKWYEEQTGEKVTVIAETFDTVENVKLAVEGTKADYDLLCPSDYMVEYLIKKQLVKEYDKSIIDVNEDGLFKAEYLESTKEFDPELKYAVPYLYGTLALLYDITKTGKKITSWEALFGDEFVGRRSIKDSMRDSYAVACIYNFGAEIKSLEGKAQKDKIQSVFEDTSAETVRKASETLKAVKRGGAVWDIDNVKFDMAENKGNVAVALMWSCDAGYVMNNYEDADGVEHEGNRNLWYVVPEEGGNVYIDAFVISKYAKNVKAANYFLKFLCRQDIAVANSEYAGSVSPVAAAYDELYDYYTEDEEGMFDGTAEGWKEMFIEMMFPTEEILNRCGVMKDFGVSGDKAVTEMWSNIQ